MLKPIKIIIFLSILVLIILSILEYQRQQKIWNDPYIQQHHIEWCKENWEC